MTSPMATYRIRVFSGGICLYEREIDVLEAPLTEAVPLTIAYNQDVGFEIERPRPGQRLRLSLATEAIAYAESDELVLRVPGECWFLNEMGESEIRIAEDDEDDALRFTPILRIPLIINPHPETQAHFEVMISDLTEIHAGLAHDVVSRGMIRRRDLVSDVISELYPETVLPELQRTHNRLAKSLESIAEQPVRVMKRQTQLARYRAGDRVGASSLRSLIRAPETQFDASGNVQAVGKMAIQRSALSEDLPEHRHLAHRIQALSVMSRDLASHCSRMAASLAEEAEHWGNGSSDQASVFEQRDIPRITHLHSMEHGARHLAREFRKLLRRYSFLQVGKPRTPFHPTPIFSGRRGYREAYRALHDSQHLLGVMVDGQSIQVNYRSLAQLYEYWCFMNVIRCLRQLLGNPVSNDSFVLVDSIYRPEMKPGQTFEFAAGSKRVLATYEPSIYHWRTARRRGDRYGATLTKNPLRPDILLEIEAPGRPTMAIVLDAKSTCSFQDRIFREISDYARQIISIRTGVQPVRGVFLLHRDHTNSERSNLPPEWRRRVDPYLYQEIGSVPCVPEQVGAVPEPLERLLRRLIGM